MDPIYLDVLMDFCKLALHINCYYLTVRISYWHMIIAKEKPTRREYNDFFICNTYVDEFSY